MTQIARVFESSKSATEAANELKANKFPNIRLATAPTPDGRPSRDATRSLASAGFTTREAEAFAGSLKNGGTILCVELPFGRGRQAEQILDRHGPSTPVRSDSGETSSEGSRRFAATGYMKDAGAAPFSTLLRLPVLTDPRPLTVSSLGDQRPTFPTGLLRSDFSFSRLFGLPLLTQSKASTSLINDPAPLSTWLGLPVLLNSARAPREGDRQPTTLDESEFGVTADGRGPSSDQS
jgi:hypothetical protein